MTWNPQPQYPAVLSGKPNALPNNNVPATATPSSCGRFGDINADPAYAPKSAPKQELEFERTYRNSFEEGVHFLRFLSHPVLLPNGFHYSTWHSIPSGEGKPLYCQCTESYAPDEPCYTCCLLKDLDDWGNNQNDSVLNREHLGDRASKILIENSQMYCRSIMLPFISKGRAAMVVGRKDQTKSYRQIYPDGTAIVSGILSISPDKPHPEYGGTPDKPFHQKLQLITLTDQDLINYYQTLAARDPERAQKFYAEGSAIFRNPNLFDVQSGSWVAYNRGKKGVPMSIVCQPPSPLDPVLIAKYLGEKTFPNIKSWGSGGDNRESSRLDWYEQRNAWKYSWVGEKLQALPWDMDLEPADWVENRGAPTQMKGQSPTAQPPKRNYEVYPLVVQNPQSPVHYIDPTHIPF